LLRAVTYGVAIPEGSEAFLHLGQAWQATRLIAADLRTTSTIELRLSADLDPSRQVPQIKYRDAMLPVVTTEKAEITCQVSDFLQHEISEELQSPWPMCPDHHNLLHAHQVAGDAVWYCHAFQHSASAIGQLPRSNPNGHRS
jgi:hypothetical protein